MTPALSERYVSSLQIEATSLHPLIEKYIRTGVQSEDLNPNFFFDFSPVPFQVRALIDQMRSPLPNLIGREGNGIVSLAAPVDYAFFAQCLEFDPVFDFFGEEKSLKWNPEPYFIKMRYSARGKQITVFRRGKTLSVVDFGKTVCADSVRNSTCGMPVRSFGTAKALHRGRGGDRQRPAKQNPCAELEKLDDTLEV